MKIAENCNLECPILLEVELRFEWIWIEFIEDLLAPLGRE